MRYCILFFKKLLCFLLKPLSFLPAVFMMYMIFSFSAQPALESGSLSLTVSKYVILIYNKILMKGYDNNSLERLIWIIHPYIRKTAHITEYFLLAFCVAFPLYVYRLRGIALTFFAGLFCIVFALLDEYHQSFVSGRVCSLRDVAIDSIGIIAGVLLVRIIGFIGRKTIFSFLADKPKACPSKNSF